MNEPLTLAAIALLTGPTDLNSTKAKASFSEAAKSSDGESIEVGRGLTVKLGESLAKDDLDNMTILRKEIVDITLGGASGEITNKDRASVNLVTSKILACWSIGRRTAGVATVVASW
jgi:hypothetical protein